ncbi:MAG: bifunctional precorrin-2 dehydrogenase/sirohydrochlorin ferrochelatase [Lachnospiraceae bacterium]|nr:bifunctional precorrin-2 dehydrogenase/sirohydrochlorin ferrochelatase [Lachnospiraceae bacterium]
MYFPLFVDLSDKRILVVGAGQIARRRICVLEDFALHITVVAPNVSVKENSRLTIIRRCFEEPDLDGMDIVLAATDNAALNRHIGEACKKRGILVNVCTDLHDCDFQFPSIVENGSVVIGINASGQNHHLVKETRKKIEALFEEEEIQSRYETF